MTDTNTTKSFDDESKQKVLRRLLKSKEKAHILATSLRFKGRGSDADEVAAKAEELTRQVDRLLIDVMREWLGAADRIEAQLRTANESLQTSIRKINQAVNTASNVVKAIGFIDDTISIAAKLV